MQKSGFSVMMSFIAFCLHDNIKSDNLFSPLAVKYLFTFILRILNNNKANE